MIGEEAVRIEELMIRIAAERILKARGATDSTAEQIYDIVLGVLGRLEKEENA